jgi:tetratricopeptide (TPR) repeat protein|tara:strand:- start:21894 stop:22526 length:633 start_codon:yes stop_codon:yes gene_type:complete
MFINKAHEEAYQYLQNADFEKAIKKYTACIKDNPNSPELYSERGVAFLNLKDEKKCISDLNKSVELQPDYAYRYASRGHARDFFGDTDGAIEDYELAAELDPNDSIVYNNLGLLLEKKGNISMAKENYDRSDELRIESERAEKIDLETLTVSEEGIIEESRTIIETTESDKHEAADNKKSSRAAELKKFFSEKNQWSEFLKFLKNGFKIK